MLQGEAETVMSPGREVARAVPPDGHPARAARHAAGRGRLRHRRQRHRERQRQGPRHRQGAGDDDHRRHEPVARTRSTAWWPTRRSSRPRTTRGARPPRRATRADQLHYQVAKFVEENARHDPARRQGRAGREERGAEEGAGRRGVRRGGPDRGQRRGDAGLPAGRSGDGPEPAGVGRRAGEPRPATARPAPTQRPSPRATTRSSRARSSTKGRRRKWSPTIATHGARSSRRIRDHRRPRRFAGPGDASERGPRVPTSPREPPAVTTGAAGRTDPEAAPSTSRRRRGGGRPRGRAGARPSSTSTTCAGCRRSSTTTASAS